jgi:hypothetical protein
MRRLLPGIILLFSTTTFAQLRGPTIQILISAAGSVQGANGTFFRSDISLINYRGQDQLVSLQWLPQRDVGGAEIAPQVIMLRAGGAVISEDFVASVMQQSGLGAIVITAVTSTGSIDPGGLLYATERIWSPQPDKPTGTVSQTFPVLAIGALNAAPQVMILGQRADDRYPHEHRHRESRPAERTYLRHHAEYGPPRRSTKWQPTSDCAPVFDAAGRSAFECTARSGPADRRSAATRNQSPAVGSLRLLGRQHHWR